MDADLQHHAGGLPRRVQRLADLNAAVTRARTERIQKESLLGQMRGLGDKQLESNPLVLANPLINGLKADLAGLQRDLAKSVWAADKQSWYKLADGTDYYTINPKGYVPLLELDDGQRLSEGPAIVQYIADLAPASGLAPAAGTMARAGQSLWLPVDEGVQGNRFCR